MKNENISDEKIKMLKHNLNGIADRLGMSLYKFRRDLSKNRGINPLATEFKRDHRPVFDAANTLPSVSTLWNQTAKESPDPLKKETVVKIAQFCSKAFAFDEPISDKDLLNRNLVPFPQMHKTGQWNRYSSLYRCFYFHPDFPKDHDKAPVLIGGLLKLWEKDGVLQAFLATGIRRDIYFDKLEQIINEQFTKHICKGQSVDLLHQACKAYSDSLPNEEMRLVTYQGHIKTELHNHFLIQLQRYEHQNSAFVFMRRFDRSAQSDYTGGIASVTLCRGSNISNHAMIVARPKLSLLGDEAFLTSYLNETNTGAKGFKIKTETDTDWNQDMLERIRNQSDR